MRIFKQLTANSVVINEFKFIKELAMEAYLIENQDILKLDETNFCDVEVLDAEIALKKGRRDRDGRIDILAKYGEEYLAIIELKKEEINFNTLEQLENYLYKREDLLKLGGRVEESKTDKYWGEESDPKWVGVLVGESIDPELQKKLQNGYEYNCIPIAGMTLRRFRSENNEIFVISDTYFKFRYISKDYSKFIFNNKEFNKGRLVNAVVKNYVEKNPKINYTELKKIFSDNIQGAKYTVFDTKEKACEIYNKTNRKRHYINDNEVIHLVDEEISTSTQWNIETIKIFINQAEKLGFKIDIK